MIKQNRALGILLSFVGYSVWIAGDAFVKLASERMSILEILCIGCWIASCFTLVMARIDGGVRQLVTKRPGFHLLRSFLILGATYCSVAGVIYLSLADFYTIIFSSPLILTILGAIFLKEKVSRGMGLAILFGFCGVIIAVQFEGTSGTPLSFFGVFVTCLGSLALALTMLTARISGTESNYALSFWPAFISALGCTFLLLISHHEIATDFLPMTYAILCGVMGGLGTILTNASLRLAPVAVVSPYHYTQIVGGAVAGYLIWHQVPAISVVIGGVMVIISGLYILRAEEAINKDFATEKI